VRSLAPGGRCSARASHPHALAGDLGFSRPEAPCNGDKRLKTFGAGSGGARARGHAGTSPAARPGSDILRKSLPDG